MQERYSDFLIISGAYGDTRRYRSLHLYEQLRLLGLSASIHQITDEGLVERAAKAKMVVIHRTTYEQNVAAIIAAGKANNAVVLADMDDLIFDPQMLPYIDVADLKDPIRYEAYRMNMDEHKQTLLNCDGVLVTTKFLADEISKMGKPTWVHRNAADSYMVDASEKALKTKPGQSEKVIIGYASGSPTHNKDLESVAGAAAAVMKAHENTELWLIGPVAVPEALTWLKERIVRKQFVRWRELPNLLAQLDINLAPLLMDNPFSQSKSEIKYMEAAMVGVPTIASATDAYRHAIDNGVNGYAAANEQEFEAALTSLVSSRELRGQMGYKALEHVQREYYPEARAADLAELLSGFPQLEGVLYGIDNHPSAEARVERSGWDPACESRPYSLTRGLYSLRTKGPVVLSKQVWIYIRRALSRLIPYK